MSNFYLVEKGYFLYIKFVNDFGWIYTHLENPDKATIFDENHAFLEADIIKTRLEKGYLTKVDVSEYNDFKTF